MESIYSDIRRLYPPLSLKIKVSSRQSQDESFHLLCASNSVDIEAASPLAESFALSQLLSGLQARRLGDIVGENRPLFHLRPLWLQATRSFLLPGGIKISLPSWVVPAASTDAAFIEELSLRIKAVIELGFNLLVFAADEESSDPSPLQWHVLRPCLDQIRASGLKLAIQMAPQEKQVDIQPFLRSLGIFRASCDFIFWQQGDLYRFGYKPTQSEPTDLEQATEELFALEQNCIIPVMYHATAASQFLMPLSLHAKTAVIAFSALSVAKLHPIFHELTRVSIVDKTKLLPFLEIAQLKLDNGMIFCDLPLDRIENILGRQRNGRFCGAGCKTQNLQPLKHFSQSSLWVMGQRMWRQINVHALFETWLERFHPEWHSWLQNGLSHQVHLLFQCLLSQDIATASRELARFSEQLSLFKEELKFQKVTVSLQEFSKLLYLFQVALKRYFENLASRTSAKMPLELQNFTPIFLVPIQPHS